MGTREGRYGEDVVTNDVIERKMSTPRIPLHIVQRDIGACRWRRGRGRGSKEHAPARVDEAEEKGRRERRLHQTEGERNQLRQAVWRPGDPGDDCADERDENEESEDIRHFIDLAPPTSVGGSSSQT